MIVEAQEVRALFLRQASIASSYLFIFYGGKFQRTLWTYKFVSAALKPSRSQSARV
jgi:hypothetical protein